MKERAREVKEREKVKGRVGVLGDRAHASAGERGVMGGSGRRGKVSSSSVQWRTAPFGNAAWAIPPQAWQPRALVALRCI